MPQNEARAWWAEAADLRETIERRRADEAPGTAPDVVPANDLAHVRARRAIAQRERTGRSGRFDREPRLQLAPEPQPEPVAVEREPLVLPPNAPRRPLVAPVPRRTVQITGRPGERRLLEVQRRRAARTPTERVALNPDRLAMWAVAMAFFLILVAALSTHS